MHEFIRSTSYKRLLTQEAPALLSALMVAEVFYKFGSFALECLAFLPTWYVFSLVIGGVAERMGLTDKLK